MGLSMDTIFITNDELRAKTADEAGVDRIMVDLEVLGKPERQRGLDTVISRHTIADLRQLRPEVKRSLLMVRVNPVHENTEEEVEACIGAGADILMLPMFTHANEAREFIETVNGRARTCLLLETSQALVRIDEILRLGGIDEVHIGLNDLHLSLKLDFMFEIIAGGLADYLANCIRDSGLRFGIGGVARLGPATLDPELILSEHVRLGSSQVILSRDFHRIFAEYPEDRSVAIFRSEVEKLRACVDRFRTSSPETLLSNSQKLKLAVRQIVEERRATRLAALQTS